MTSPFDDYTDVLEASQQLGIHPEDEFRVFQALILKEIGGPRQKVQAIFVDQTGAIRLIEIEHYTTRSSAHYWAYPGDLP